jgi:16S rRNA (uracil1498-N3)-methyltransferase
VKFLPRSDFRTPRLFVDADLSAGTELPLDRAPANYLQNVLRLEVGARVLVFNGRQGEWASALAGTRRHPMLQVRERTREQAAPGSIDYVFAPLKHARLDYMVQKAVEMGVASLTPVVTQHTQVTRVNLERMRANVIEAAEQCGVLAVPAVNGPAAFAQWLAELDAAHALIFCDEEAEIADPIAALNTVPPGATALLVGPEGGFAEAERARLLNRPRTLRLSLGPRILRADTAAVAALALVQSIRGDWR